MLFLFIAFLVAMTLYFTFFRHFLDIQQKDP